MDQFRGALRFAGRWRYAIWALWAFLLCSLALRTRPHGLSDWLWFEFGARTLIHLNSHYNSGALGLYAHYPVIQIGPPPLLAVAAFQWLGHSAVETFFAFAMAGAGLWCLRCAELASKAVNGESESAQSPAVLGGGLLFLAIWAPEVGRWQHLDDVMALTMAMTAMMLILRGGRFWWLAGLLVGLAVASKPWAIVCAPCLLALPRSERARAGLIALTAAAACWVPFVLGDPHTLHSLAGFRVPVGVGSTPALFGAPVTSAATWVRPLQFVGGFLLTAVAVRRRPEAALLVAFGFRIIVDPQWWPYYGLGPLVGAILLDRVERRSVPVWTLSTVAVAYLVPGFAPSKVAAAVRLVWFVVVLVVVLSSRRPRGTENQQATLETAVPAVV